MSPAPTTVNLSNAESITTFDADCVWIWFDERAGSGRQWDWIDWKLRGALTRAARRLENDTPIFIPTGGRITARYAVLAKAGPMSVKNFFANCTGQNWSRVLFLCHDIAAQRRLTAALEGHQPEKGDNELRQLLFSVDVAPGEAP